VDTLLYRPAPVFTFDTTYNSISKGTITLDSINNTSRAIYHILELEDRNNNVLVTLKDTIAINGNVIQFKGLIPGMYYLHVVDRPNSCTKDTMAIIGYLLPVTPNPPGFTDCLVNIHYRRRVFLLHRSWLMDQL